jgi:hypothetical protein
MGRTPPATWDTQYTSLAAHARCKSSRDRRRVGRSARILLRSLLCGRPPGACDFPHLLRVTAAVAPHPHARDHHNPPPPSPNTHSATTVRFGPNALTPPKKPSFLAKLWGQLNNVRPAAMRRPAGEAAMPGSWPCGRFARAARPCRRPAGRCRQQSLACSCEAATGPLLTAAASLRGSPPPP